MEEKLVFNLNFSWLPSFLDLVPLVIFVFGFGPSRNFRFWIWSLKLGDWPHGWTHQPISPRHRSPRQPPLATCAFF